VSTQNITYSFLDVHAAIVGPGGFINLGASAGIAEEGVSIDPSGEIDTMTIGADGSGMHSLSADRSGKVTVRLLKTSPTNALLMLMYNFQTSAGAQHGQNTITLADMNRGDVVTCKQAAFAKAPNLQYAKIGGLVEWEFNAVEITRALGAGI
jgi:hypothetical protein